MYGDVLYLDGDGGTYTVVYKLTNLHSDNDNDRTLLYVNLYLHKGDFKIYIHKRYYFTIMTKSNQHDHKMFCNPHLSEREFPSGVS